MSSFPKQPTTVIVTTPRWRRRKARERAAEEARWKALSGPVRVIRPER